MFRAGSKAAVCGAHGSMFGCHLHGEELASSPPFTLALWAQACAPDRAEAPCAAKQICRRSPWRSSTCGHRPGLGVCVQQAERSGMGWGGAALRG